MRRIVACKVVLVVQIALTVANGFVLPNKGGSIKISAETIAEELSKQEHSAHQTTVRHYARHELCRTFEGKRHLYIAMKTKICGMSSSFIEKFVLGLCRHKNQILYTWVEELFDIDGNGVISHFEKQYYT